MLTINTRNDKLAAARINFSSHGMLNGTCLSEALEKLQDASDDDSDSEDDSIYGSDDGQDLDADEDEDLRTGPVDGPPSLSNVTLAQKRGQSCFLSCI